MKDSFLLLATLFLLVGCRADTGSSLDAITEEASPEQVYFEQLFDRHILSAHQPAPASDKDNAREQQAQRAVARTGDIISLHHKGRNYPDELIALLRADIPELQGQDIPVSLDFVDAYARQQIETFEGTEQHREVTENIAFNMLRTLGQEDVERSLWYAELLIDVKSVVTENILEPLEAAQRQQPERVSKLAQRELRNLKGLRLALDELERKYPDLKSEFDGIVRDSATPDYERRLEALIL
ncbi:MAG TPA: hypothetical protein VKP65_25240 [Rhodothermales bacterium]|nr:hypothetical protein [Rhodothermales bacterium]